MTQCERHGPHTARLHHSGVGAVPADADRGVDGGPARARLQARRRSAGARRRRRSICRPGAPAGWRRRSFSTCSNATPRSCRASCRSATSTRTSLPSPRPRSARRRRRARPAGRADWASARTSCSREIILKWAEAIAPRGSDHAPLVANSPAAALALASDLARLMDDMATRQVPLGPARRARAGRHGQILGEHARLSEDSFTRHWPALLEEKGCIEPAERRDKLIAAEAKRLADQRRPGDRGGLDRLDPGDRDAARHHREAAARRAGAARPRHRSRRSDLDNDRQRRRRQRSRAWPSAVRHVGAAAADRHRPRQR